MHHNRQNEYGADQAVQTATDARGQIGNIAAGQDRLKQQQPHRQNAGKPGDNVNRRPPGQQGTEGSRDHRHGNCYHQRRPDQESGHPAPAILIHRSQAD
jgi:hypothetical protein